MSGLQVRPVADKKDLKNFIRLSHELYALDPNWVAPLDTDLADTLSPTRNPFFQHAQRELFIAFQDGKPVGRIAAIIDHNYTAYHNQPVGFFGFFESAPDYEIARVLFDQARAYLRAQGMTTMRGPANPSLNDEAGMLLEGFDSPPCIKMSYNPPYYIEFCERYGMTKAKDLFAYLREVNAPAPEKLVRVLELLKRRRNLVVRLLNPRKLAHEVALIKEIYNDAWSKNWDFAPMTDLEIDDLARKLKPLVVPELIPFAEVNGEVAGVGISLPDYNQVLRPMKGRLDALSFLLNRGKIDAMRLWALGVKHKFHRLGIDALLYYETFKGALKKGYRWCEVSWILEDNQAIIRPIQMWGFQLYKKYRVFEMAV